MAISSAIFSQCKDWHTHDQENVLSSELVILSTRNHAEVQQFAIFGTSNSK